jgi:hypothetical protein
VQHIKKKSLLREVLSQRTSLAETNEIKKLVPDEELIAKDVDGRFMNASRTATSWDIKPSKAGLCIEIETQMPPETHGDTGYPGKWTKHMKKAC